MLNLKEIRTKRKISQSKLADAIGVSRSTIAMWETGGSQPDNDNLKSLSQYFSVTTDYLLGREDNTKTLEEQLSGKEFALLGNFRELTPEDQEDVVSYMEFKKSQRGVKE